MLAIWKAGKIAVPLNYLLPPTEIGFIIKDSGMFGLVSSAFFSQALAAFRPVFGDKGVILLADASTFLQPEKDSGTAAYRDPALYLYLSGPTRRPRRVSLTHVTRH